jgi:hypothetical protein
MTNEILTTALRFAAQGIVVVPVATDGSKRPGVGSWKQYQERQPTQDELLNWFNNDQVQGLGVITGPISNNLLMIEWEGRAIEQKLHLAAKEAMKASGLEYLWETLTNGYSEMTPSGGIHFLVKIDGAPIEGNTKLASKAGEDGGCLIETRGAGGFSICAPSGGTAHPNGKSWTMIAGSIENIPTITEKELWELFTILKTFDEMPKSEITKQELTKREFNPALPGDDYNQRMTWEEILEPLGWKKVYTQAQVTYWRRPNKDEGISASTNYGGYDTFFVFSTSTTFQSEKGYSKFATYAHLNHHDDFKAAAQALRFLGFGVGRDEIANYEYNPTTGEIIATDGVPATDSTEIDYLTAQEIKMSRAKRTAKKLLDAEEAASNYHTPIYVRSLTDELKLPIEEVKWTIKDVFPTGANVTLTAQYKAGKTTLINSLAKSLADGEKFLNYFDQPDHKGRIVIFNYEVSENQYRRWMNDVAIESSDKITLVHLRGKRLPLTVARVEDLTVSILKDLDAQTWILDPFARAFTGCGDENSNSDVGVFLDTLDVIKERAGVSNLVLPIHTGRAQENGVDRARGATRLDDWADVRWLLKKTQDGRFFSADGRDVLQEEQMLTFDETTRSLTLGGVDSRMAKKRGLEDMWIDVVAANPGLSTSQLSDILGKRYDDKGLKAGRDAALRHHKVKTSEMGRTTVWYPADHFGNWEQGSVAN